MQCAPIPIIILSLAVQSENHCREIFPHSPVSHTDIYTIYPAIRIPIDMPSCIHGLDFTGLYEAVSSGENFSHITAMGCADPMRHAG